MKTLILSGSGMAMAVFAAGCASTVEPAGRNPYAAAAYTGADQLYQVDKVADLHAPQQWTQDGALLEVVSYEGIQGARMAHQAYADETAEKLDGRCERFVSVAENESLTDIAALCDVPMQTLVSYNPDLMNVSYLSAGQVVEIPGGVERKPATAFSMGDQLAALYTVHEGETLNEIAARFNVSSDAVSIMNPDVSWTDLKPGRKIIVPVAVTNENAAQFAPGGEWEGYSGTGIGAAGALAGKVTYLAPYRLRPVDMASLNGGGDVRPVLVVDQHYIQAGKSVTVTAKGLPEGTPVTFYSGENLQDMRVVGTTRIGPDGQASESVRTSKKRSNMGGVVFKATREDTGETLYSDRVGVFNLKAQDTGDDETEE